MSWLLYNLCAWAHETCETVNKSSKSDICYIDSGYHGFSLYGLFKICCAPPGMALI